MAALAEWLGDTRVARAHPEEALVFAPQERSMLSA
jgi:hypothetical protein